MRGIRQAQLRSAGAELNLVSIEQGNGFGDPLAAHQSSVEAFQIADEELIAGFFDLGMTPRDNRSRRIDHDLAFRIAAQPGDFLVQLDPRGALRVRIN